MDRIPKPPAIHIDTSPSRRLIKRNEKEPEPESSAFDRLKGFTLDVLKRHEEVSQLFSNSAVNPTLTVEFRKFITDSLSEVSMRYVMFGTFTRPGETPEETKEEKLKEQGFDISKTKLESALAEHPAAKLALELGADLTGDDE